MTAKLQHIFALSEKGARDFVKAVIWCFLCNISLMLPGGRGDGGDSAFSERAGYRLRSGRSDTVLYRSGPFGTGGAVGTSLFSVCGPVSGHLSGKCQPAGVSLAETLRKLPLSFFGNRDLSDLTATMIADCSSLDQMFSHYIPQLFASIFSTLFIGICMFCFDWRMALAVLWVLPVAVLLTAGSKKLQDAFGTRNILAKRAGDGYHPGMPGNGAGYQGLQPAGRICGEAGRTA